MRKKEFVYLHELFSVVRTEYERQLGHSIDCAEYERLEVRPSSFNQSKTKHKEAVCALASDLSTAITEHSSSETKPDQRRPYKSADQRSKP
ncbi:MULTISPECIES: UPF0058 family protein [Salinibaculum]|uniref:UPF0058 family protein n=1 Tax=Salinibaculum TaxID=2732368 RepID=UPI00360DC06D